MDKNAIIQTAPIIKGGLVNREREVKEKIVLSVLDGYSVGESVTTEGIARKTRAKMNIELQPSVVGNALEKLETDGILERHSGTKYRISSEPNNTTFEELYSPVWEEFREFIIESEYDQEIDYTIKNYRRGLKEVFLVYYRSSISSESDLSGYSTDSLSDNSLSESIQNVSNDHSFRDKEVFGKLVREYIQQESEVLTNFFGTIYIGIVNQDLLSRAQDFDLSAEDDENKVLFLDTNAIIPLVCDSDDLYLLMKNVCKRSRELGYDLFYLSATADEMDRVVRKTKQNLSNFRQNVSGDPFNNQFITDFNKRQDISSPKAYQSHIGNWRKILESHGIYEYDNKIELDEKDEEVIESWVKELDRIGSEGNKSPDQIKHDAQIILTTVSLRNEATGPVIGPFGISNNTSLLPINNIGKNEKWQHGVLIDPQGWLNYLITFTPAEFVEEDKDEFAKVILSTAADFDDDKFTLDEYMGLLAAKSGISEDDSGYLKEMIMETPLAEELEDAARRGDGEKIENIGYKFIENIDKYIEDHIDTRQKLKNASEQLNEVEKERRAERERRKQLEEVLKNSENLEVNVDVDQNVDINISQDIQNQVKQFIDDVRSNTDRNIENTEIPKPPSDISDPQEVQEWLQKTDNVLNKSNNIVTNTKDLAVRCKGLLALLAA